LKTCPEEYLLWFHHVAWDYKMKNGKTLWQNLQAHYNHGVEEVARYCDTWQHMRPFIDSARWHHVADLLDVQLENARKWRTVCLDYFGGFVK
jgi:alpha-glucuronidase